MCVAAVRFSAHTWSTHPRSALPNRAQFGSSALHLAASGGFRDVVRLLLHHGADARATDAGGWSALHWAGAYNVVQVTQCCSTHPHAVQSGAR